MKPYAPIPATTEDELIASINYPHLKEGVCCSGSSLAETR